MKSQFNVHIVHAHPESKSFVSAMRDTIYQHFKAENCSVSLSDLYAKEFNAIASKKDFLDRSREDYLVYSLEQRHCRKIGRLSPDIVEEIEYILKADLIVFTFPLFWFSVPAILKGWIDRVFIAGLFYGGNRIYQNGGMLGKRAFVAFSLGGRSHMFGPNGIHGELTNGMLRHFFQGTLGYVGIEVLEPYVAYHVPYVDIEERQNMLDELKDTLIEIDHRPTLSVPDLNHYNEIFEPIKSTD